MQYYFLFLIAFLFFSCQQMPRQLENGDWVTPEIYKQKKSENLQKDKVFFKNINEGDTLESPFVIEMGVVGMKIKPAGELEVGTGHHHIIIDKKFMKYGEIIPMDANHLHYGKGDTVVNVALESGEHILTLQFANGMHMSFGEQFSKSINIYVK